MNKINNYINHVLFVLDQSGSMLDLTDQVVKVFDAQIAHLAKRSKEMQQETRVTVFVFNTTVECIVYDKDVLRLPSLKGLYRPSGSTALIDATLEAIADLQQTPEKHGDHAFLGYVMTDGEENASRRNSSDNLRDALARLPDNWTMAVLVPDQKGVHEAKHFGFPASNIAVWSTTTAGVTEAGRTIREATESFMTARTQGIRGTRTLFATVDTTHLTHKDVIQTLVEVPQSNYLIAVVRTDMAIRDFVEHYTQIPYRKGCAFYLLTKPETVQSYKLIAVRNKQTGKVFTGLHARQLLGIPDTNVRLAPGSYAAFDVYIQSTSVNRRLIGGTTVLVMR